MPTEANKVIVRRLIEGFNTGDLALLEETVAPQYLNHHPFPGQQPGLDGLKELLTAFRRSFPDLTFTIEEMVAEQDYVTERVSWRGTHRAEFAGIAPTGRTVTVSGIEMFHIADGKIIESWIHHDLLALFQQLGAIPTPGQP
jgi:steroid delta-isomerase-like uncharacterized protein